AGVMFSTSVDLYRDLASGGIFLGFHFLFSPDRDNSFKRAFFYFSWVLFIGLFSISEQRLGERALFDFSPRAPVFGSRCFFFLVRRLPFWRRFFNARLHAGAGRQPPGLANTKRFRRRFSSGTTGSRPATDARGIYRFQAFRDSWGCRGRRGDFSAVISDD